MFQLVSPYYCQVKLRARNRSGTAAQRHCLWQTERQNSRPFTGAAFIAGGENGKDFFFLSCHVRDFAVARRRAALLALVSLQTGNSFLPSTVHPHESETFLQLLQEKKNKILLRVTSWK